MPFSAGTVQVGDDGASRVCTVPVGGVKIRNLGGTRVFFGGEGVTAEGEAAGYPLDPGQSELFPGVKAREVPVVPAPPDDMYVPGLFGCTAKGTGTALVTWIAAAW